MDNEILDLISEYRKLSSDNVQNSTKMKKFNSMRDDALSDILKDIEESLIEMRRISKTITDKLNNDELCTLYFKLHSSIVNEDFNECSTITEKINDIEQNKLTN